MVVDGKPCNICDGRDFKYLKESLDSELDNVKIDINKYRNNPVELMRKFYNYFVPLQNEEGATVINQLTSREQMSPFLIFLFKHYALLCKQSHQENYLRFLCLLSIPLTYLIKLIHCDYDMEQTALFPAAWGLNEFIPSVSLEALWKKYYYGVSINNITHNDEINRHLAEVPQIQTGEIERIYEDLQQNQPPPPEHNQQPPPPQMHNHNEAEQRAYGILRFRLNLSPRILWILKGTGLGFATIAALAFFAYSPKTRNIPGRTYIRSLFDGLRNGRWNPRQLAPYFPKGIHFLNRFRDMGTK